MSEEEGRAFIAAAVKDPVRFGIDRCCICPGHRKPYVVGGLDSHC